jgi:hypothetical protein
MPPKKDPRAAAMERNKEKEMEAQRRAAQEAERREAASWQDGADSRTQSKLKDQEDKAAAKAAKRAEMAALLASEEDSNSTITSKKAPKKKNKDDFDLLNEALAKAPKTKAQLEKEAKKKADDDRRTAEENARRQKEEQRKVEEEHRRKALARGIVIDHGDEMMVKYENRLDDDDIDASGLDSALQALSTDDKEDAHPERRQKALHKAYFERMLPQMKEELPGLKLSQYKERIFEMWKNSPENPNNNASGK